MIINYNYVRNTISESKKWFCLDGFVAKAVNIDWDKFREYYRQNF